MQLTHRQASRTSALLLLFGTVGGLSACGENSGTANRAERVEQEATNLVDVVPKPRLLDRAGMLEAVRLAASAAAIGTDDREAQRSLDGRQFEVRIRFGCAGGPAAAKEEPLGWTFDEKARTLRIHATPTISPDQEEVASIAPEGTEAVEGFWLARPWMVTAGCPAPLPQPATEDGPAADKDAKSVPAKPATAQAAEPAGRIGIAEFFTDTDARTGRRDRRPFRSTQVLDEGRKPGAAGFNLVLSGRLRALPGGKVINCVPDNPDRAPNCVVSADFDRVWIEWPDDGTIVAQWGRS